MLPEPQPGSRKMPLEVALPEEGLHKMGCECMFVSACDEEDWQPGQSSSILPSPEPGVQHSLVPASPVAAPLPHGLSIVAQTLARWEHDLAVQLAVSRPLLMWCWQVSQVQTETFPMDARVPED
ncbi:hypothetical protein E5288_WYG012851 [Bos mutus]|uniref:Uncharacterized protein n=1 Tax=Bos mutus TaxID=72004 RepID=A0A6B0QXD3_9CETA|nr:hypothetical protein [Bos mutus]